MKWKERYKTILHGTDSSNMSRPFRMRKPQLNLPITKVKCNRGCSMLKLVIQHSSKCRDLPNKCSSSMCRPKTNTNSRLSNSMQHHFRATNKLRDLLELLKHLINTILNSNNFSKLSLLSTNRIRCTNLKEHSLHLRNRFIQVIRIRINFSNSNSNTLNSKTSKD